MVYDGRRRQGQEERQAIIDKREDTMEQEEAEAEETVKVKARKGEGKKRDKDK